MRHTRPKCPSSITFFNVGNPRYQNQELNESGFRSYFRENNSKFTLLEPLPTYESSAVGRELVEDLLKKQPDCAGYS